MKKLVYQATHDRAFTIYGEIVKQDEQFLTFNDRYKGEIMIPMSRVIEIIEVSDRG